MAEKVIPFFLNISDISPYYIIEDELFIIVK